MIEDNTIWLGIPSANIEIAKKTFPIWKDLQYKIAIICPDKLKSNYKGLVDILFTESETGGYKGWAKSVNFISNKLKNVNIIIAAGDDMYPDKNFTAYDLQNQFFEHFKGSFGVMQPYGDKYGSMARPNCEQICGSAWLGKDFRNKINKGKGPLWEEYWHMWADTELYQVAIKYNCLWIRHDLNQYHEHRRRGSHKFQPTIPSGNTKKSEIIYKDRKIKGFPGTDLLE
jgi:hypothetical protein